VGCACEGKLAREALRAVDLIVVGNVDSDALARMCHDASAELGVEVKATTVSLEEWRSESSGLVRSVKAGPLRRSPSSTSVGPARR
jgi:hypothetical protein